MAGWIDSPPSWSLGIYNYGLLYNENTGWHAPRQCHITVCTDNRGENAHISVYDTNGQEIRAPFSAFEPAPWDTAHAGAVLDAAHLAEVTAFNLYLGHGSGAATTGVVYVDDIRAE